MYELLSAPIPDAAAYLDRIGLLPEEVNCDLPSLHRLIRAHVTHVPFENIDVWDKGLCPNLEIPALFDKIVLRRRGGYCFELNAAFQALLTALGFEVYPVAVRIMIRRDELQMLTHRGGICVLGGKKYYCDVGFGGLAFTWAVPLDGSETPDNCRIVCEDGVCRLFRIREDGTEELLMHFDDRPVPPIDFLPLNFLQSQNPELPFRKNLSVSLSSEGSRKQLVNFRLRKYDAGENLLSDYTAQTRTELSELLLREFGIDYPMTAWD